MTMVLGMGKARKKAKAGYRRNVSISSFILLKVGLFVDVISFCLVGYLGQKDLTSSSEFSESRFRSKKIQSLLSWKIRNED
jgi:hypothetical protein